MCVRSCFRSITKTGSLPPKASLSQFVTRKSCNLMAKNMLVLKTGVALKPANKKRNKQTFIVC